MIAKRVDARAEGRFAALARYLLGAQGREERVEAAWAVNTGFEDVELAVKEITATQRVAGEGRGDPTYHLIVSFREGERPDPDQLREIETHFAEALGFGAYQRLVAVHGDTENMHMHIAINRVHPETLKRHTPFRDFYALDETCAALEAEYGLARDNRIERGVEREDRVPQRARDMEAHQGVESFAAWVQGEPKAALKAVLGNEGATWDDVHRTLARFDLEIRPRGAGCVITDWAGRYRVRASDVLREASKDRLEARFGLLEAAPDREGEAQSRYDRAPRHAESRKLWRIYSEEREARVEKRRAAYEGIREDVEAERDALRRREAEQRAKIWSDPLLNKAAKIRLTQGLTRQRMAVRGAAARRAQTQRAAIRHAYRAVGWTDWLRARAERGDGKALSVLRRVRGRAPEARPGDIRLIPVPRENAMEVETGATPAIRPAPRPAPRPDRVDRRGVAVHTTRDGGEVRDDGTSIVVDADPSAGALRLALDLAAARGAETIRVEGPEADRPTIARYAGQESRPVRFLDPDLEAARSKAEAEGRETAPRLGGGASSGAGASAGSLDRDDDRADRAGWPSSASGAGASDAPEPLARASGSPTRKSGRPSWMPRPIRRDRDDGMDR